MTATFAYDEAFDPPAPVVRLRVTDYAGEAAVLAHGIVDTGADCTRIPPVLARAMRLPQVDQIDLVGVAGGRARAPVYAGWIELAGGRFLVRLVACDDEVIVGRDVLNRLSIHLDGPGRRGRLRPLT